MTALFDSGSYTYAEERHKYNALIEKHPCSFLCPIGDDNYIENNCFINYKRKENCLNFESFIHFCNVILLFFYLLSASSLLFSW